MADALDPRRTALLVVDMQESAYQGDEPRVQFLKASGIHERLATLIPKARAAGVTIVYVLNTRRADGADQASVPIQGGMSSSARPVEGTPGWQVLTALKPETGDFQVIKRRRSAFYGSDLDLVLRTRGIRTVIVGGQRTSIGVESTVREAFDRDFGVIVLRDGCGGVPDDEQAWAMERTFPGIARVMTCAEIAALLG
jgi:nicotinamidase-related amidase